MSARAAAIAAAFLVMIAIVVMTALLALTAASPACPAGQRPVVDVHAASHRTYECEASR